MPAELKLLITPQRIQFHPDFFNEILAKFRANVAALRCKEELVRRALELDDEEPGREPVELFYAVRREIEGEAAKHLAHSFWQAYRESKACSKSVHRPSNTSSNSEYSNTNEVSK